MRLKEKRIGKTDIKSDLLLGDIFIVLAIVLISCDNTELIKLISAILKSFFIKVSSM